MTYTGKHAAAPSAGQHAVSATQLPTFPSAPPPPPACSTCRIEAKLDWLYEYLTKQIAKPWDAMPPWPGTEKQ